MWEKKGGMKDMGGANYASCTIYSYLIYGGRPIKEINLTAKTEEGGNSR